MILRRFMKHVSDQNWFAVGLDVLVVIFGVYVGVFLGDIASQRATHNETVRLLTVLKADLQEDLEDTRRVVAGQTEGLEAYERAIEALLSQPVATGAVSEVIGDMTGLNPTFFPNRSTYQTMREGGNLASLRNSGLQQSISDLFERRYSRHQLAADQVNDMSIYFQREIRDKLWDRHNRDFVQDAGQAPVLIRNSLGKLVLQARYYRRILQDYLQPTLQNTIMQIDLYLEEQK